MKVGISAILVLVIESCGGVKLRNYMAIDYTNSQRGAYNLNFNQYYDSSDSLHGVFLMQYYFPTDVTLHLDSATLRWSDSSRPVTSPSLVRSNLKSRYNGNSNASGAGPFATMIVGVVREGRPAETDTLTYSFVVSVRSTADSSQIETVPMTGRMVVAAGKKRNSK
jgi:hypothetical protein